MKKPLIFDIKRTSTVDGEGIRTVIFFKGCNLDCFWCHNPEGKSPAAESAFFAEKCVSCGNCVAVCKYALNDCESCGECAKTCPTHARRLYGREYSLDELVRVIESDKPYFDATGGGVTFSGGECMLYPEYLASVARLCKERGISVAIDTAGCVPFSSFEAVLPYTNFFLYDIKCLDSELHKKGTGRDNALILQNLDRLIEVGARIIVRTPVIPDFNEGEEINRIIAFCKERGLTHELLPYHTFGEDKKEALKSTPQKRAVK